ncbi:MAG: hypothetical protein AAB576_01640, partial [Elusimicrobiota bacterium]
MVARLYKVGGPAASGPPSTSWVHRPGPDRDSRSWTFLGRWLYNDYLMEAVMAKTVYCSLILALSPVSVRAQASP